MIEKDGNINTCVQRRGHLRKLQEFLPSEDCVHLTHASPAFSAIQASNGSLAVIPTGARKGKD